LVKGLLKNPENILKGVGLAFRDIPSFIDVLTKVGLAYYGVKAFNHPSGALVALLGLELAKSQNAVAGASGIATLGAIGLTSMDSDFLTGMKLPFNFTREIIEEIMRGPPEELGEFEPAPSLVPIIPLKPPVYETPVSQEKIEEARRAERGLD